jgi:hypothetical protein
MSLFSIENILQNPLIKPFISHNTDIIKYEINNKIIRIENSIPLSLKHPRDCQPEIPKKNPFTLIHANLKTFDDIFDIDSAIKSIFAHTEDVEYNSINPYHKWSFEIYSEQHGYTQIYIIVSLISKEEEPPYYAIEVELIQGKKRVVNYILNQLKERLNIS